MANNNTKLEIINENPKDSNKVNNNLDSSVIEMVFGTPTASRNNVAGIHLINNESNFRPTDINHRLTSHEDATEQPSQPLLEPDRDRQKPPLAGPEIDDLDDDAEKPHDDTSYTGIDDGLLDIEDIDKHHEEGENGENPNKDGEPSFRDIGVNTEDGNWPWTSDVDVPDYPYDGTNLLTNRFGDDRPMTPFPGTTPDVNTYQQKKNLAQGMMDLALLSANANQLRYVLESSTNHPYFYSSLTFITISIIIQIAVGVGLILNSRYDVNDKKDICTADKINNMTVLGVFLITIVNVFIASFSVGGPTTSNTTAVQQTG